MDRSQDSHQGHQVRYIQRLAGLLEWSGMHGE
jgi:hypothetical protein